MHNSSATAGGTSSPLWADETSEYLVVENVKVDEQHER
jgi:hypothetical protein